MAGIEFCERQQFTFLYTRGCRFVLEVDFAQSRPARKHRYAFAARAWPAQSLFTPATARRAAMIAVEVVDTGPMESVLAKNTRRNGRRASGSTWVWFPGVTIYIGCPRR